MCFSQNPRPFQNISMSHKNGILNFICFTNDIINTVALIRNGAKSANMLVSYRLLILFSVLKLGFESRGMSSLSSLTGSFAQRSCRPAACTHSLLSAVVHLTASAVSVTLYCGLPQITVNFRLLMHYTSERNTVY